MPYKFILFEKQDYVGTITLNRPERLNALSTALHEELASCLDDIQKDDDVRVVVLTGAPRRDGRPCFSAGGDLKEGREIGFVPGNLEMGGTSEEQLLKTLLGVAEGPFARFPVSAKLWSLPKPTIAAIDGVCTVGGLQLAMSCDLRIAAETAEISDFHMIHLGIMGGGLQFLLGRLVGAANAKEILWTGAVIDGKEAWRIGLVNRVFPSEKMMGEARKLAKQIATMRPLGIRMSKMVINASLDQGIFESLRFSDFCHALTRYMTPQDQKESFAAFVEKRKPNFTGA